MKQTEISKKITEILKKDDPVEELTRLCRQVDPCEQTITYIWIRIWEVAGKKDWLVPFLKEFKRPLIPKDKIVECATEVKKLIPETSYRDIIKCVMEFTKNNW